MVRRSVRVFIGECVWLVTKVLAGWVWDEAWTEYGVAGWRRAMRNGGRRILDAAVRRAWVGSALGMTINGVREEG